MPNARLRSSSPYAAIQYDADDETKQLARGAPWTEVTDEQALFLAYQHRADVELDGASPEAQAQLEQHDRLLREQQSQSAGNQPGVSWQSAPAPKRPSGPDLARAID